MLILGFHAGCNSRLVNSERDRTKMAQKEDVQIISKTSELINGNRLVLLTDSSSKFFSVEIFPLDTFTFSVNDGFKGKASKIEFMGIENEVQRILDSTGFRTEREKSLQYSRESQIKEKEIKSLKEVKTRRSNLVLGLIGFIIFSYYLFHKKIWMKY